MHVVDEPLVEQQLQVTKNIFMSDISGAGNKLVGYELDWWQSWKIESLKSSGQNCFSCKSLGSCIEPQCQSASIKEGGSSFSSVGLAGLAERPQWLPTITWAAPHFMRKCLNRHLSPMEHPMDELK